MPIETITITSLKKILPYDDKRIVVLIRGNANWEYSHSQEGEFYPVDADSPISFYKAFGDSTELEFWARPQSGVASVTLYIVWNRLEGE